MPRKLVAQQGGLGAGKMVCRGNLWASGLGTGKMVPRKLLAQ